MSTSSTIDAVILDYGNVLIQWDPVAAVSGLLTRAQWQDFCEGAGFHALNLRSDAGEPFEDVVADLAATHPSHPEWVTALRTYRERFQHSITGHVPGTREVVRELLDAHVPLYLLTNFDHTTFRHARHLVPELARFQGVVVSGEEHLVKPDPALYGLALTRYGLDPARTLFVDDSPANTDGAQAVGLRTHLFTSAGDLRAALVEAGLLTGPMRHPNLVPLD